MENRNNWVFQQVVGKGDYMIKRVECYAKHIVEAKLKINRSRGAQAELGRWCPLSHQWVKVNTDGVVSKDGTWSAIRGVLCESFGN